MNLHFYKYQATGNDFILIDNREIKIALNTATIQNLCHRKFGVGSDGVILIESHEKYDYHMQFYNPDGSQSLCGNGARCGFVFAQKLKIVENAAVFQSYDGVHKAKWESEKISISLHDLDKIETIGKDFFLNTGSPHYVKIVENINEIDIKKEGKAISTEKRFEKIKGTNVNFIQPHQKSIAVRTFERGVNDETLSCGTGVTAVALVGHVLGYTSPTTISTKGGELTVKYEKTDNGYKNIWLSGTVNFVYEGYIQI